MRFQAYLLPAAACLLAMACKNGRPHGETAAPPAADVPEGWTVFEDADFRLSVPAGEEVKSSTNSWDNTGFPVFVINHKDSTSRIGTSTFAPYELRTDMLIRDAAELELKDYIADGGKVLSGVKVIPMRSGSCAVFTAVAGTHCREPSNLCGQHNTLAHCDSPRKKKRYSFDGFLGFSGNVDKRPPGFAEHVANYEKIIRSIEFKQH